MLCPFGYYANEDVTLIAPSSHCPFGYYANEDVTLIAWPGGGASKRFSDVIIAKRGVIHK
jgi:hypothetical protein